MLLKSCPQYASKFGKLSSGHRTGKGQFSFQYERKAMPKNSQTIINRNNTRVQILNIKKLLYLNKKTITFQFKTEQRYEQNVTVVNKYKKSF